MPLLFSYGTLQQDDIQLATYRRRLDGHRDALVGFQPAVVKIEDSNLVARLGNTHHHNVTPIDDPASLASGRQAWVYVHVARPPA